MKGMYDLVVYYIIQVYIWTTIIFLRTIIIGMIIATCIMMIMMFSAADMTMIITGGSTGDLTEDLI